MCAADAVKATALAAMLALGACTPDNGELDRVGRPADSVQFNGPETRIKVDLPGAKDNVKLVRLRDGSIAYVVKRLGPGTDRLLTPVEFAEFVYRSRSNSGWMESILNITSPAGIVWVALGLLGQLVFTGRMIVQWLASERSKRSVIPVAFWWMSLVGAVMLVTYFVWRRDIVGIVGQATGLFIYARNLVLIRQSRGG
ncbi:MAG: lipid-A-disaccharide synthase N-terminal domain-containing protein [Chthoniobacterales bacterium]